MSDKSALVRALKSYDINFERLYRIEIQRAIHAPPVCAPEPSDAVSRRIRGHQAGQHPRHPHDPIQWETTGLLYDLHDRTLSQILDEIEALLEPHSGLWRLIVYYWSGTLHTPTAQRHMGNGESFIYNPNPRGDLVLKLDPPIEVDLGDKE